MALKANWIKRILEELGKRHAKHADKVSRLIPVGDPLYEEQADRFFSKWFGREGAWKVTWSLDAYVALLKEMESLQDTYAHTRQYPNTSFAEVDKSFYKDSGRMRRHLEALAIAQFLWIDQWERFLFFSEWIEKRAPLLHLEVGPGHGLYLDKTVSVTRTPGTRITAVDVSPQSLETARAIAGDSVQFIAADFLEWNPVGAFDTLTMGEVLEHVENPLAFLRHAKRFLHKAGSLFISTPLHAPMPDHITAYEDLDAVRDLLARGGYRIEREHICAVDNISPELAQRFLKPIMYSAVLIPS